MPLTRSLLSLLVLILFAPGCRAPSARQNPPFAGASAPFPIGIFGVPSTNDFPRLKEAGFNTIVGRADQPYLDAAYAVGLRVLAEPGTQAGPEFDPAVLAKTAGSLDRHPALWAWYLCDEPDLNLVSPSEVSLAHRTLRAAGAHKPGAITLCQGSQALDYAARTDFLLIDRYPIPWLPLANFGQHVRLARFAAGEDKTLIAIVQAFDWTSFKDLLSVPGPFRPPTAAEMRCMTYDALARGADGIFYYEFDGGWKIQQHSEVWQALQSVVKEVGERRPLFQGKRLWWGKVHDFGDRRSGFNAALESSVTSTLLAVVAGNSSVPAGRYIVAVNNTDRSLEYRFLLPAGSPGSNRGTRPPGRSSTPRRGGSQMPAAGEVVAVLGEERAVPVSRHWISDSFGPYAVHIYGPLP